ncbi:unnamed protein product [Hymenolepis diminuta]|uniref:Cell division control protein 73 C-terminal domain-containing protein n=1 Tax=Hymenolepis diminuta TaxID=6216 RepID=A0A564YQL2_HYMDI|nr:unnamed protein product [Hymenolepis diminuta]
MADVLSLLREYTIANKNIAEIGNEIIFGEIAWPRKTKTNYIMWGTGKDGTSKDYYTLDCILYLLRHVNLPHSKYVRDAATDKVPVVRLPDRRDLLNYLNGTIDTTASIDRTVPVDISSRRIIAKNSTDVQNLRPDIDMPSEAKRPRLATFDSEEQKSVDDQSLAKSQPNLEPSEGSALPSVIPLDAIQSLRAKFRANQQALKPDASMEQRIGADNLDPTAVVTGETLLRRTPGQTILSRKSDPNYQGPNSIIIAHVDDQHAALSRAADPKRAAVLDADLDAVRVISSRERRWRTRTNILQSQAKTFFENIVSGILHNVSLKENARLQPSDPYGGAGVDRTGNNFFKTPLGPVSNHLNPLSQPPAMQYSRYDQERFAAGREDTAGFRIDTMSSYHGKGLASMVGGGASAGDGAKSNDRSIPDNAAMMPPPTPAHETPRGARTPRDPRAMGLGTPGPGGLTPDPYRSARSLVSRAKPRASRVPIIIVPAAPTSLITMINAADILQDFKFISPQDKIKAGAKRQNELTINRLRSDGRTVPYRVVDQPTRLQPDEWNRVVAVFVQGQAWQFKGWPYGGDPALIFSAVKGFHLKYSNMPLDANVAKWNVTVINLDQRRHLDKVNFQGIWDQLERFIAKNKSFLRY